MKIRIILAICILQIGCLNLFAQTEVSGIINTNTTWTTTESPYLIIDDLSLSENITLTIEPGVVIKFTGGGFNSTFTVNGTLLAQGTTAEPIVFTEGRDDSYGGDTNNDGNASSPAAGNWEGINITGTSSGSVIDNCLFRYGGYGNWEALNVSNSSTTVTNNHFYRNALALSINNASSPQISSNIFEEDTYAPITINLAANPVFSNNQFLNCKC